MFFSDRTIPWLPLGVIGGVIAFSVLGEAIPDVQAGTEGVEGADARPVCKPHPSTISGSFFKEVLTPDVSLFNSTDVSAIRAADGWFVVNSGTTTASSYDLYRLYPDGTIRAGGSVPSLSIMGPTSIHEIPKSQIPSVVSPIPPHEMRPFYQISFWPIPVSEEYRAGLERRLQLWDGPVDVLEQGADSEALRKIEEAIFDEMHFKKQPVEGMGSTSCERRYYASITADSGGIASTKHTLLALLNPEARAWVAGHEIGHALDRILDLPHVLDELPPDKRADFLQELKEFREYLVQHGKPHNGLSTGREILADAFSYALREPALLKEQAPLVYEFLKSEIARDQLISKLVRL